MLHNIINDRDSRDVTNFGKFFQKNFCGSLKGLRIGIPKELFGADIAPEVSTSVMRGAELMAENGAELREVTIPSLSLAVKAYYIISSAEASSNLARYDGVRFGYRAEKCTSLADMYRKTRSEGFGSEVKRRIMLGTFVLSEGCYDAYYKRAEAVRRRLCAEFDAVFADCDIIAAPVYPKAGIKLGADIKPAELYAADLCTVPSSMAGLPAISVPCGRTVSGLPIGLQLIGRRYADAEVLSAAYGYELAGGVY